MEQSPFSDLSGLLIGSGLLSTKNTIIRTEDVRTGNVIFYKEAKDEHKIS
jgi:hypothetical protein